MKHSTNTRKVTGASMAIALAFAIAATVCNVRAQNAINVNISTDASGAATKTINPPSGSVTYCAADIFDSGTTWNNIYKVATYNANSTGVTNVYQITTNKALVDSQGASSGAILNIFVNIFDLDSNTTRVEPNNGAGGNTVLGPAGLMNQAWRIFRGGNSLRLEITGLTANKEYDLYVYGSTTTTNQGCKFTLAAANVLGANPATLETIGGNNGEVFNSSFVPIPAGITWGVLHAISDGTGKIIFHTSKNVSNGQYFNGFQLQPICEAPGILASPTNVTASVGSSAAFSVSASGDGLTFQWRKNGVALTNDAHISGATASNLVINPVAISDIALNPGYDCLIENSNGCSTLSSAGKLYLYSTTMTGTPLSPANGGIGICPDTVLKITFNVTLTLNNAGLIRIYDAANPNTPVNQIDLSQNNINGAQSRNIGGNTLNAYPVIVSGNTATIFPNSGSLTNNKTYYVLLDPGTFSDSTGALYTGLTNIGDWTFTTKANGPSNPTNLVVAADGSGDFCTVQGALNFIPANNAARTLIRIRNGYYQEIVNVNNKHQITFRGEDRQQTLVAYPNNNNLNPGAPWRASFIVNGNDCAVENITITNSTPKGGSQAEAIDVEGTRFIGYNMNLASFQDTFLTHSDGKLIYFQDSLIQGDTDFIWGYGTMFVTNCEIRCLTSGGHITQPRSPLGQNGFSFVNCRITKGFSSGSFDLGRSINTPTTPAQVIYSTCLMDDAVSGYASDAGTNFWTYSNSNLTATVQKTSLANATELPASSPVVTNARNSMLWFNGWQPQLSPNILSHPTNQTVDAGTPVTMTVSATGIPVPTYQWLKDSTNVPGATSNLLSIASAQPSNTGTYSVVVSNAAGAATSSNAVLNVNAPVYSQPTMGLFGYSGGQFSFTVSGDTGPDYTVLVSTNLMDWDVLFTTNAPTLPFVFTDNGGGSSKARFYRVRLDP